MNKEKILKKTSSFDDLEIEKLKKEKLSEVLPNHLKRVKDDFDIAYQHESKDKILEKPLEKKSRIAQFFEKIATQWDKFKNSKVGKILFSNGLSYAISLTSAAIAVSGFFTPVSPLIIAIAGVAAIGVGIQAIGETVKIRNLRKLHKENNLLVQNRNVKAEQDYILSLEANLNNILKNELYTPPAENKNYSKDKYKININLDKFKNTTQVIANNTAGLVSIANVIAQGASGNVIAILKATSYGVLSTTSLISSSLSEEERREVKAIFKLNINEECKKKDTPNYQNLAQLENYTKEQTLQTLALKKLITDKNYWSMKDEDKRQKFKEIKNNFDIEAEEKGFKAFFEENKITIDTKKESYVKDIARVMNPFYKNPSKAKEYSNLAKVVNKKERSTNKTIAH